MAKIDELEKELGISDEEFGYIGCEINDIAAMKRAGFAVATADAIDEVKELADYVTKAPGGRGAIREICEVILDSMGKWDDMGRKGHQNGVQIDLMDKRLTV